MFQRYILQYLSEAVKSLEDDQLLPEKVVYFPNEPIPTSAYEKGVFFEVFTGNVELITETEISCVSSVVGSIVINGKTNAGTSFLDAIAEALAYSFSASNPRRKKGFRTKDFDGERYSKVYVSSVERSESGIDNGRYKITVFITFDIYEDVIHDCR